MAHFSAELETALRTDLSAVLADIVSDQIINGSGVSPQVDGILNKLTNPGNVPNESAYADYIAAVTGGLGKTASSESEVRLLVGLGTYVHARGEMVTSTAVDAVAGMRSLGCRAEGIQSYSCQGCFQAASHKDYFRGGWFLGGSGMAGRSGYKRQRYPR